jgi:hypothetical protein
VLGEQEVVLKAQSLTLLLSHYETGRYREIRQWHNGVHRVELQAMVPHIYHSEDLVAPPEYLDARAETELKWHGGECLSLYWSEGSAADLGRDVPTVMQRNREQGYLNGPRGQELTYRRRMHVLGATARPGLDIPVDMVPLMPHTGVIVSLLEVTSDEFAAWHARTLLPRLLTADLCTAAFALRPMDSGEEQISGYLYYLDAADPLAGFRALQQIEAICGAADGSFAGLDCLRRHIFAGLWRPVVDGDDPYD